MDANRNAASAQAPAAAAREVLSRLWDGELPVDPVNIAKRLGLQVEGQPSIDCSGAFSRSQKAIYFNSGEPATRRRFTVAHELGHYVLNHDDALRDKPDSFSASTSSPIESAANRFAAELLMPARAVVVVFQSGSMASVDDMARAFGVSKVAMAHRLANLNLV